MEENSARIRLAIVEDEALIADGIRRAVEGLGYEVVGISYDFENAVATIPGTDADLFLLDINLGSEREDQNGIALAGLIKASNPKPFIFLTAYSDKDTIAKATALHPANYLIKPVAPAALFAAIQLAIARTEGAASVDADDAQPDFFYVKLGSRKVKLYWKDVYCMEAGKNYVRLFSVAQTGEYPIRGSIAFVLEQLVPKAIRERFFRLGRSYCLNKAHVSSFGDDTIVCGGRSFENEGRILLKKFEDMH